MNTEERKSEELKDSELDSVAGGYEGQPPHWGDTEPGAPVEDGPHTDDPHHPSNDNHGDVGEDPKTKQDGDV